MNRTCGPTAIASAPQRIKHTLHRPLCARLLAWGALCLVLLSACTAAYTPVRPVHKIGLIAPFEGLYREDGYALLAGVRQAITECAPPGLDVVPLALDDSADPAQAARALQKLLLDPAVTAIVGPLALQAVSAVAPLMHERAWSTPHKPRQADGTLSLDALLAAIHAHTDSERVLVVSPPLPAVAAPTSDLPYLVLNNAGTAQELVRNKDAILWLDDPAQGAAWFATLRAHSNAPFFLGTAYGAEIFARHATRAPSAFWMHWQVVGYTPSSKQIAPDLPEFRQMSTEFAYHVSCAHIAYLAGTPIPELRAWRVDAVPFFAGTQ